ncbi:MAG: hypothetical protein HQ456_00945 [Polynucleobacter sp.]|nr:hypothetical protein [Polynucleobacter sp.]
MIAPKSNLLTSIATLFASSGTLICCALPALLVALGAGATLSTVVSIFPKIVWISEHKIEVFTFAGVMLTISGYMQWRGRFAPCPVDPILRNACLRTRKISLVVYLTSLFVYLTGGWFAFVQPMLTN